MFGGESKITESVCQEFQRSDPLSSARQGAGHLQSPWPPTSKCMQSFWNNALFYSGVPPHASISDSDTCHQWPQGASLSTLSACEVTQESNLLLCPLYITVLCGKLPSPGDVIVVLVHRHPTHPPNITLPPPSLFVPAGLCFSGYVAVCQQRRFAAAQTPSVPLEGHAAQVICTLAPFTV